MREQSKKSVKTRLLALVLVFCMTLQMTSYGPGNVVRAEGEGADAGVSEEALTEEGLPESTPSPETTEIIEEAPADVPEKEPAQPTDWTGQNDKLKLTLTELSYQKGDEAPVVINSAGNKWDLSALTPEDAGQLTFKWQYAFAEDAALNSGDTFSLSMPKTAEDKALIALKDTEAPVALADEQGNTVGSYEIKDSTATVTLNEAAAESTEAVSGILELSGVLNAETLKAGETTDAILAPQGEAGGQWTLVLPGKAAAEPIPSAEPTPTTEPEQKKENPVMNGLKALFGVQKVNETHNPNVTNETSDITLEIGYVEYVSPDGIPTRCPITKSGSDATVDMSKITYEPGGRFRIELDFNLINLANIKENDYFEFYIPKEFSFSGTLGQKIDLMDGSDKIADYVVSKLDNNADYAYLLKVTFAEIVDDPSVSGINGGVTFELGMNEDLNQNASPHNIPLQIQGTAGPTTTIVTPGISHKIKGITKDAVYDKEKGTITWSIGVGTDSSCAGSDLGSVKVTDTLPDELKNTIESVWIGPAETGESVDVGAFKQAGNSYTFPDATSDKSYKAPQTLTIVTKVPDTIYDNLAADKSKDASKTFTNTAKMTSDSKFISFDGGDQEASKAVSIKRPGVVKEGVQKSSDIIAWMITINDTGSDPRNNIYRAVVTDTMSEDLIFRDTANNIDMASTISVTNKDTNAKVSFEEYTGEGKPDPDSDKKNYYQYNADTKQLVFYFYGHETIGDAYTIEFDTKINTKGMEHTDYDQNKPNEKLRNEAELTCSWPHGNGPGPGIQYGLGPIDTDFKAAYVTKEVTADESTGIMTWTIDPGTRLETLGNYTGDKAVITDTIEDNQTYQLNSLKVYASGVNIDSSKYAVIEPSGGNKELKITITDAETLKQLNAIKLSYQTKGNSFYGEPDSQVKTYHNRVDLKVTENSKNFSNYDDATAVFPNRFLNKNTKFVEENGELYMEYTITANENKMLLTSLTITDDFKNLKTTIKNNNDATSKELTNINSIWTIEGSKTSVSINGGSAITGSGITGINYNNNQFTYTPTAPEGNSYTVKLYLKMTEEAKKQYLGQYDSIIFTENKVTATGKSPNGDIDNYTVTSSGENEGKIENKLANKFSVENPDDMILSWVIDINPHAATMKTDPSQEMKIEDTIPTGLEFDLPSVKLYKIEGSNKTEENLNLNDIIVTTDAEKKQTMTVPVPEDKTTYRLEYSTKIVGNVSGGNAQNNAVLSVGGNKVSSSSDQNDIARTAWAKLERLTTYQFKKYDAQAGETLPLVDAKFGLYSDENCKTLINYYESDEKGMVQFRGLENGKTYYYKEISAPEGYKSPDSSTPGTEIKIEQAGGVITGPAVSNERIVKSSEVNFTKAFNEKDNYSIATTDWISTFKLWLYPIDGNTSYKVPVELTGTAGNYQYSKADKDATATEIKNKDDGSLKITGLPWGSYALEEVKAADGYAVPEGDAALQKFSIAEANGVVSYERNQTITNIETNIRINKYLDNTTKRVEDAKLSIRSGSADGTVVKNPLTGQNLEWISDGNAWDITGLPAGTYWLVEDTAPTSNEQVGVAEPIQFELDIHGKINGHSDNAITMKDMTNTIKVKKLDQFGKAVKDLEIGTLRLREKDENGSVVSDANPSGGTYVKVTLNKSTGEYTFSGMHREQTYYLEEPNEVSNQNYLLARPITFKIDATGKILSDSTLNLNNETGAPSNLDGMNFTNTYDNNNTLTLRDERITGHATFTKWDNKSNDDPETKGSALSGVSFDLYKVESGGDKKINTDNHFVSGENGNKGVVTTVGSKLINVETNEEIGYGLLPGTYYFKEVETHGDFVMPEGDKVKSVEFMVSKDNRYTWKELDNGVNAKNVIALTNDMYNTPLRTDIVLHKTDAVDSKIGVIGATYGLYYDDNGKPGALVTGGQNNVERKVTTRKANEKSDEWTDTNGNKYQHNLTQDGEAYFCDVKRGTYRVKEISPAPGYTLSADTVEVVVGNEQGQKIDVPVINTQTEIQLKKVNSKSSVLENAQFTITPASGKTFADGTSVSKTLDAGENAGALKGQLIAGDTYTVSETTLPAGYTKINDFTIEVENNGDITVTGNRSDVTADNTRNAKLLTIKDTETSFNFQKIDQFGDNVSGASLELSGTFANATSPISWNTSDNNANPKTIAGELIAGNQYTLRETVTPDGYWTVPDVEFTVSADGKSLTVDTPTGGNIVALADNNGTLKLTDRKVMGHAQLTKTDSVDTSKKLEGVIFEIYKEGKPDQKIAELKTDKAGIVTTIDQTNTNPDTNRPLSDGLSIGKYYFIEKSTLNNYVLNTDKVEFTVNNNYDYYDSQGNAVTANLIQKEKTNVLFDAKVTLQKLDATSNTGISDVAFTLSRKGSDNNYTPVAVPAELTGFDGKLSFNIHEKGSYKLTETVPAGYTDSSKFEATFDLTDACHGQTLEIKESSANQTLFNLQKKVGDWNDTGVLNVREKGSITVQKVNENSENLSGAEFTLYQKTGDTHTDSDTFIGKDETDNNGKIVFDNLEWGEYWLLETKPPVGYQLPEPNNAKKVIIEAASLRPAFTSVDAIQNTQNSLVVKKQSREGAALYGATLEVYDSSDQLVSNAIHTSGDTWELTGILTADADYYIKEASVPEGYKTPESTNEKGYLAKIHMDISGNISLTETYTAAGIVAVSEHNVIVKNEPIEVSLNKADNNGQPLTGAAFKVTGDFAGGTDEIEVINNNSNALYAKLVPGREYTITETKAPDGYKMLLSPVIFTVDTKGQVNFKDSESVKDFAAITQNGNVFVITVKDDPVNVGFVKTSGDGTPIAGAELKIVGVFSDTLQTEKAVTSNATDAVKVSGLIVGKEYTLTETKPAYGYQLAEQTVKFKVQNDGTIQFTENPDSIAGLKDNNENITFKNEAITASVKKTDEKGQPLPGVTFDLKGKFADNPETSKQITSDNGNYSLDAQLIAGESYTLKETAAPQVYQISATEIKFTVSADGKTLSLDENYDGVSLENNEITIQNTLKLGDIVFTKKAVNDTDDTVQTLRDGVTFGLYSDQECTKPVVAKNAEGNDVNVTAVSDKDGTVRFKDMPVGVYYIKEMAVANDVTQYYKTNTAVYKADIDGSKTANTGEEYGITLADDNTAIDNTIVNTAIRGSITLKKINNEFKTKDANDNDITLEIPLSGAQFAVCLDNSTTVVAAITEKSDVPGEYELQPVDSISLGDGYTRADANGFGILYLYHNKLLAGQYDIFEVTAPAGYVKPETAVAEMHITETASDVTQGSETNSVITNVTKKQDIALQKLVEVKNNSALTTTADATAPKAGFTFKLERIAEADGKTPPVFGYTDTQTTTGDKGMATFKNVPVGTYKVTEISTTETDYVVPGNYTQKIVVDNNGNVSYGESKTSMVFENSLKRGSITGTKVDASSHVEGEPGVAGAVIGLYENADDAVNAALATTKTDADGNYTFGNIPYGTYYIKEKAVPENSDYLLNETQMIEVTVDDGSLKEGKVRVSDEITNTLPTGSFTIEKTDAITGTALAGVTFKLEGKTSDNHAITAIENKKTDSDGKVTFDNIPVGKYTLTETASIDHYQTPTETAKWEVELIKDNHGTVKTKITDITEKDGAFQITNNPIVGSIRFTKKDTDGRTLAGIGFTLTREGDLVDPAKKTFTATSDADGVVSFIGIPYGDYQLTENKTVGVKTTMEPVAIKTEDLKVAADGQSFDCAVNSGVVENTLAKGSVSLTKVDQNDAALAGVAFDVTRKGESGSDGFELNPTGNADYTVYAANPQVKSNDQGVVSLDNLPMGSYKLTENFEASSIVGSIATGQKPITVAFTIDAAGKADITPQDGTVYQENNTWKIKNFLKSGTLQINKIFGDQDSAENTENTARPNAKFDIFADSNNDGQPDGAVVMTLTTNEKGQFVSNEDGSYTQDGGKHQWLLEGNYLLKETASGSEDYMTDPGYHHFTITEKTVAWVETEDSKIINKPYRGTLEITKFDEKYTIDEGGNLVPAAADNNTQLNGAIFAVCLKGEPQNVVTTLTPKAGETGVYVLPQNAAGQTIKANALGVPYLKDGQLLKGDYTIVEVTPPTGYEDKQTTKDIAIGTGENADIVDKIANVLIEKPFAITKLAETADEQKITESGEFKAAAKDAFAFTLTRDAGQTPEFAYTRTVKTDENGIADFKEIPYGTYTLAETETPDSHIPAVLGTLNVDTDGVHYTTDNKTETTANLSVDNSLKRGSITGRKIDNTTALNIEHGVSGAVMGLFTKDGKTKLAEAVTAKDGSYGFDNIPYGDYQIREITAPEGYNLSLDTSAAKISENGTTVTADAIHDTMIKGSFTMIKKDAEGEHAPLAGATFTLSGTNFYGDAVNIPVTTGENGEAVFNDIPLGSYTLTESTQPENFTQFTPQSYKVTVELEKDNTAKTTLTPEDSDKALKPDRDSTYSITNERNKGNIVFNKVGITGEQDDPGKPLSGAKFGLYRDAKCSIAVFGEDNKPRTAVSDERGTVTFKDVSFGEYYVKEIGHVINYLPGAKAYKAVVNGDGSFNGLEDTTDNIVTNERNKGSVTLTKVDSEDSNFKLDGAEFTVYQNDKPVKTGKTGDDGILLIDGLLLGQEYRITETKAPVGHQLPDPEDPENSRTFTLIDDQATESETAAQVKLNFGNWENEPNQGDIIFTKYGTNDENNKDSKAVLPGAVFGLYKNLNTTQEVQQATSSPDGTVSFKDIYVGSYYVKEISTPANYQADETIYQAIIKEDGTFDGLYPVENNVVGSQKTDTVINEAVRGSISIHKTDSIDNKPLEGVEFTLAKKDSDGKDIEVQKAKTDSDGKLTFSNLLMDTQYTVTETATLDTYILSTRQESMTLKDTDAERDRTVDWTNTPTELTFKKVDTTGAGLKGAVFTLYDGGKEKTTATSAEDGTVIFRYLEKGKSYTVKETSRPGEDYLINTTEFKAVVDQDGTCTLKDNDQTVTEVVNADAGVITLTKIGDGGNVLAGAVFDLKNDKGEVIQTQTTAENGQLMFKDVPMGSYTIVEIAAPDTYQVSDDVTQVTLSRGAGQKAEISRENTLSQVIFHKRGIITETCAGDRQHAPLEGAEYGLYSSPDCAGEPAYTAISGNPDDDCKVVFTGVARGIWYVKEMSAPQNYLIDQTIYKAVVDSNGHYESLTNLDGTEVADNRVIDDAVTTDIVLKKVNEQNPEEILPGSTYGLFKKAAKAVPAEAKAFSFFRTALAAEEDNDEWQEVARATTDDKGYLRFEGVLMGVEYTVRELIAPEGSHVSEKPVTIKFKVDDQTGKVVVESIDLGLADPDDPNSAPTAAIDPETGEIVWLEPSIVTEISKVDVNQNLLAGAKLRITVKDESGAYVPLTQADGQPVEWVSGDKAEEFVKLMKLGEDYRLEEIEAPAGYTLAAPIDFKVTSPEQGVGPGANHADKFVMTDELTSFYISKTIINSTDELPGAVLTVYNTAGDGSIARDEAGNEVVAQTITGESLSWTSGTEMKKIEGLKTGTYVLRETTAPDGYEVAEEITFTLMPDGTVTVGGKACEGNIVRMQDKPAPETPGVTTPQQPGTPDAPESSAGAATGIFGSQNGLWGFMALLAVSVLAICGTVVFRKKRR